MYGFVDRLCAALASLDCGLWCHVVDPHAGWQPGPPSSVDHLRTGWSYCRCCGHLQFYSSTKSGTSPSRNSARIEEKAVKQELRQCRTTIEVTINMCSCAVYTEAGPACSAATLRDWRTAPALRTPAQIWTRDNSCRMSTPSIPNLVELGDSDSNQVRTGQRPQNCLRR